MAGLVEYLVAMGYTREGMYKCLCLSQRRNHSRLRSTGVSSWFTNFHIRGGNKHHYWWWSKQVNKQQQLSASASLISDLVSRLNISKCKHRSPITYNGPLILLIVWEGSDVVRVKYLGVALNPPFIPLVLGVALNPTKVTTHRKKCIRCQVY